jgi:glycosyltransferase involved in cell wall biosynthesis
MDESHVMVSVIVPARNEEPHLPALLESLARVEYPRERMEVIVVDHQSTDETSRIARKWGATVISHQGGTIASVRNRGARAAKGDVLAFLDADCTVDALWLSTAVRHFVDPRVGAVGSYHAVPLDPPTWVRTILQKQIEARLPLSDATWLPSGNMFVRRDVFDSCGGFDESLATCEDVDLSYRIGQQYRLVADARVRCWHHGEPRTLWEVFRKELWRGRDNLLGAIRHGITLSELPSLVLPLYFLLALSSLLFGLALSLAQGVMSTVWLLGSGIALFGPLAALAAVLSIRSRAPRYFVHFGAYFLTYFIARGLGPAYAWRNI